MKTKIITLFFVAFITSIRAQDLPMKNGMIYYKFENKLNNTKVCLSNYFERLTTHGRTNKKMLYKTMEYATAGNSNFNQFVGKNYFPMGFMVSLPGVNGKRPCADTLTGGSFTIDLPIKTAKLYEYFLVYQIATFNKEKITSQKLTGTFDFVFINKSEYVLRIKGLTLITGFTSKLEEQPLGPLYEAFQKDQKKSKDLIKFFSAIDEAMKSIDTNFKETFTELYSEDELD